MFNTGTLYQKKSSRRRSPGSGSGSGQTGSMAEALMDELLEEILLRLPPDDPRRHRV